MGPNVLPSFRSSERPSFAIPVCLSARPTSRRISGNKDVRKIRPSVGQTVPPSVRPSVHLSIPPSVHLYITVITYLRLTLYPPVSPHRRPPDRRGRQIRIAESRWPQRLFRVNHHQQSCSRDLRPNGEEVGSRNDNKCVKKKRNSRKNKKAGVFLL